MPTAEPGYTTTEFWGLAGTFLLAILGPFLANHGVTSEMVTNVSLAIAGLASSAYAIGRSIRKRGTTDPVLTSTTQGTQVPSLPVPPMPAPSGPVLSGG